MTEVKSDMLSRPVIESATAGRSTRVAHQPSRRRLTDLRGWPSTVVDCPIHPGP